MIAPSGTQKGWGWHLAQDGIDIVESEHAHRSACLDGSAAQVGVKGRRWEDRDTRDSRSALRRRHPSLQQRYGRP
jgi:hypothetical protein